MSESNQNRVWTPDHCFTCNSRRIRRSPDSGRFVEWCSKVEEFIIDMREPMCEEEKEE